MPRGKNDKFSREARSSMNKYFNQHEMHKHSICIIAKLNGECYTKVYPLTCLEDDEVAGQSIRMALDLIKAARTEQTKGGK